jgi:hypothetical protein
VAEKNTSPKLGSPRTASGWPKNPPHLSTSKVGRFLRKRRSGEHDKEAPLSLTGNLDGQYRRPDRSEIGPYLGSHQDTFGSGRKNTSPKLGSPRTASGWPKNPPHLSTSEVGRFLRKRRSGEHDKEAPLSLTGNLDGQYRRPDRSEIGPYLGSHQVTFGSGRKKHLTQARKSSDGLRVAEKSTSPEHLQGRAISPKAPLRRT